MDKFPSPSPWSNLRDGLVILLRALQTFSLFPFGGETFHSAINKDYTSTLGLPPPSPFFSYKLVSYFFPSFEVSLSYLPGIAHPSVDLHLSFAPQFLLLLSLPLPRAHRIPFSLLTSRDAPPLTRSFFFSSPFCLKHPVPSSLFSVFGCRLFSFSFLFGGGVIRFPVLGPPLFSLIDDHFSFFPQSYRRSLQAI